MLCPNCASPLNAVGFACPHCGVQLSLQYLIPTQPGPVGSVDLSRVRLVDGLAQLAILTLWAGALVQAAAWIVVGFHLPLSLRAGGGLIDRLANLPAWLDVMAVLVAAITVIQAPVFIAWLWRARSNVDGFRNAQPDWRAWWTVGVWFIPLVNVVVPPIVLADVARNNADVVAGRAATELTRRARAWWVLLIAELVAGGLWQHKVTPLLIAGLPPRLHIDAHLVDVVVSPLFGAVLALAGGYVGTRMIGGISREQRQRIERGWTGRPARYAPGGVIA